MYTILFLALAVGSVTGYPANISPLPRQLDVNKVLPVVNNVNDLVTDLGIDVTVSAPVVPTLVNRSPQPTADANKRDPGLDIDLGGVEAARRGLDIDLGGVEAA